MATTHDATELTQFTSQAPAWGGGFGHRTVMKFHVDMAAISTSLAATINGSAADVVQIWDIPQGCIIEKVLMNVTTVEGAAATVAVGDGDSAACYMAATSINALTTTTKGGSAVTTDAYAIIGGKLYKTADTLDLTFATAADIDAAVFDLYVVCEFIDII